MSYWASMDKQNTWDPLIRVYYSCFRKMGQVKLDSRATYSNVPKGDGVLGGDM